MSEYIGKLSDDRKMSCSRLAALLGESPYKTRNEELLSSIAAIQMDIPNLHPDAPPPSEQAMWGILLESPICKVACGRFGFNYDDQIRKVYECDDLELQCSLDAIVEGDGRVVRTDESQGVYVLNKKGEMTLDGPGVGEIKNTSDWPAKEPKPYRGFWQVHGAMMCTGFKWAVIFTLYRGNELRTFFLEQDFDLQQHIRQAVVDFSSRLESFRRDEEVHKYPVVSPKDAAKSYPEVDEDSPAIVLDAEHGKYVHEYLESVEAIKAIQVYQKELQTKLMEKMKGHEKAVYVAGEGEGVCTVTWAMSPARHYKAQPAKEAYTIPGKRTESLKIVESKEAGGNA